MPVVTDATAIPHFMIGDLLAGSVPIGTRVTVQGWVRTRRDSKAGLSFIHLHDGSCFAPIQVVAPATLPNYGQEISRITAGCSLVVKGERGQRFESERVMIRSLLASEPRERELRGSLVVVDSLRVLVRQRTVPCQGFRQGLE